MRNFSITHPAAAATELGDRRTNVGPRRRAPSSTQLDRLKSTRSRARAALHNVGASCGDSLRHLATTADGYTLDNPYGHFTVPTDVDGWRALCGTLMDRVREHYDELGKIEPSPYPKWEGLRERYNAIVEKVNALDDVGGKWTSSGQIEAISYCTTLASEQVCFLEDTDKAIVELGGAAPSLPGAVKPAPPPSSTADLANVAIKLGAVAIAAYVLVNLAKG